MYKLVFNQEGKLATFCLQQDAIFDDVIYHDAPEGFNPDLHTCNLVNDKIILSPIEVISVSSMDRLRMGIKKAFAQKETDGKDYFETKRADLFLGYKSGSFTLEKCLEIEDILKPVKDRVITGDWLSAQSKVKTMISSDTEIESILRGIELDITNYISLNY